MGQDGLVWSAGLLHITRQGEDRPVCDLAACKQPRLLEVRLNTYLALWNHKTDPGNLGIAWGAAPPLLGFLPMCPALGLAPAAGVAPRRWPWRPAPNFGLVFWSARWTRVCKPCSTELPGTPAAATSAADAG